MNKQCCQCGGKATLRVQSKFCPCVQYFCDQDWEITEIIIMMVIDLNDHDIVCNYCGGKSSAANSIDEIFDPVEIG